MAYIQEARDEPETCLFCELPKGTDDAGLILVRGERAFAVMNAFPYNSGHLMVAPSRHVGDLDQLQEDEVLGCARLMQRAVVALRLEMSPDGFNVGMNLGRVAGAGVPGHLHWHVVPRWNGDTNFMPVVGETKVLPEALEETWRKLRPRFEDRPD